MKKARHYYSAAVQHPEVPGAYLCSIGIPGCAPEWILEGGNKKLFAYAQEAEVAGYRVIIARLNKSTGSQIPVMKKPVAARTERPVLAVKSDTPHAKDADRVFARFKKTVSDDV